MLAIGKEIMGNREHWVFSLLCSFAYSPIYEPDELWQNSQQELLTCSQLCLHSAWLWEFANSSHRYDVSNTRQCHWERMCVSWLWFMFVAPPSNFIARNALPYWCVWISCIYFECILWSEWKCLCNAALFPRTSELNLQELCLNGSII